MTWDIENPVRIRPDFDGPKQAALTGILSRTRSILMAGGWSAEYGTTKWSDVAFVYPPTDPRLNRECREALAAWGSNQQ